MTIVYQHILFSILMHYLDTTWIIIENWTYKLFPIIPSNLYFPPFQKTKQTNKNYSFSRAMLMISVNDITLLPVDQ